MTFRCLKLLISESSNFTLGSVFFLSENSEIFVNFYNFYKIFTCFSWFVCLHFYVKIIWWLLSILVFVSRVCKSGLYIITKYQGSEKCKICVFLMIYKKRACSRGENDVCIFKNDRRRVQNPEKWQNATFGGVWYVPMLYK